MNFAKIGVQGYSLGNLQLNSDELIWTSADKSRQVTEIQTPLALLFSLPPRSRSPKPNTKPWVL